MTESHWPVRTKFGYQTPHRSLMFDFLLVDLPARSLVFLAAISFVAALARGFSGFGAALIFVPLASTIVSPKIAAPLLLIVDAVLALGFIPNAWRNASRPEVGVMAFGALFGIPLGALALLRLDPLVIRWTIVTLAALMLALMLSGWRYRGRPNTPLTFGVGAFAGVFSGAAQVGGPPVVAYWLGSTIPAANIRASIILFAPHIARTLNDFATVAVTIILHGSPRSWRFLGSAAYRWVPSQFVRGRPPLVLEAPTNGLTTTDY